MILILLLFLSCFQSFAFAIPKLLICSDSTAADYPKAGPNDWQGWGWFLREYLTIQIVNLAVPGESTRSFIKTEKWSALLNQVQRGDIVVIEMGHNDEGNEINGLKHVLPGTGSEVRNTPNGEVGTFGSYLRKMIADVEARGGIPVLSGRTPGNIWNGARFLTDYPFATWTAEVARNNGVEYLDHTKYSVRLFQTIGKEISGRYFSGDTVHSNAAGARC
jgi:rhamnogalacturonan acetylesterase